TLVRLPNLPPVNGAVRDVPSSDISMPRNQDYDVGGGANFTQGNYDISLTVDPNNPNVVYLGGTADGQPTGLIRVDATTLHHPHAYFVGNDSNDGGTLRGSTGDPVRLKSATQPPPILQNFSLTLDPESTPQLNLIRFPANPFQANTTFYGANTANIA